MHDQGRCHCGRIALTADAEAPFNDRSLLQVEPFGLAVPPSDGAGQ